MRTPVDDNSRHLNTRYKIRTMYFYATFYIQ